jgi:hypothetical protein
MIDSLEAISKLGFWFKIPSSPKGFAGTRAAGPSFKPQVRLRLIEDLKRGTNKDIGPKDIFERAFNWRGNTTLGVANQ